MRATMAPITNRGAIASPRGRFRHSVLLFAAGLATVLVVVGCSSAATTTTAANAEGGATSTVLALAPTPPATADVGQPTPIQTEGPYFKAGSPARSSLVESGSPGKRLTVTGRVVTTSGAPVAGATIEFWQADETGAYDNSSFRYRGHQSTAADGSYKLETIVPGLYTGRTRHIHAKVIGTGFTELTTQLYFPDEPANGPDGIYDSRLLLRNVTEAGGVTQATFDFVLARS